MVEGALFVTGTDTEVGKTWVSCAILDALAAGGHSAFGLKPVAAGAQWQQGAWCNDDALALLQRSTPPIDYVSVNPCLLQTPVAPHIAAQWENYPIRLETLVDHCRGQLQRRQGFALIEGAGGWRVPLNEREHLSDLAVQLALPVLMVVPIRLGCINHALLTAEAIRHDGLVLAGWVANMIRQEEGSAPAIIESLEQRLASPCLGKLPWLVSGDRPDLSHRFDLPGLLAALAAMKKQY